MTVRHSAGGRYALEDVSRMGKQEGQQRLAFGIVDEPTLVGSRLSACEQFLLAATRLYPELLERLGDIEAIADDFWPESEIVRLQRAMPDRAKFNGRGAFARLSAAVGQWARRHRIPSPWIQGTALFTLHRWAVQREDRGQWAFPGITWNVPPSQLTPLMPEPLMEDLEGATRRLAALWHARVDELLGFGFVRAPRRELLHFEWLAMHTVGRCSVTQISQRVGRDRSTVSGAIHELATLLEMSLPRRTRRRRALEKRPPR